MTKPKKAGAKKGSGTPARQAPQVFAQATLTHLHYHPEGGILRAHVEQDVDVLGVTSRHGRDVDIAIGDLSADIRSALDDAFQWVAADVNATPYVAPEPEEEEEPE